MKIAIDFDGTCVKHAYPYIGEDIGAVSVLKRLVDSGHQLILNTMRCNKGRISVYDIFSKTWIGKDANYLDDAVAWFEDNGIPLHGIQKDPAQAQCTSSSQCYAELYIDAAALGIPLLLDMYVDVEEGLTEAHPFELIPSKSVTDFGIGRPYVDWNRVELLLEQRGFFKK